MSYQAVLGICATIGLALVAAYLRQAYQEGQRGQRVTSLEREIAEAKTKIEELAGSFYLYEGEGRDLKSRIAVIEARCEERLSLSGPFRTDDEAVPQHTEACPVPTRGGNR